MTIYNWMLVLSCPLPAILLFLYLVRRISPPLKKIAFAIILYVATLLTLIVVGLMQLLQSEVSIIVLGVIASTVYASYFGVFLRNRALLHDSESVITNKESVSKTRNKNRVQNPMLKWLSPVIATIIGGILMWWLTQSNFSPFSGGPDLKIISFEVPNEIYVGERVYAECTVFNEGRRTAEGCRLTWYTIAKETTYGSAGSFGVPPNQSGKGKAWIIFNEVGDFTTTYGIVGCEDGIIPGDRSFFPEIKVHVLNSRKK